MTKAERFAKLNPKLVVWHEWKPYLKGNVLGECSCGGVFNITLKEFKPHNGHTNPTFPDAKSILEVMMKREDWKEFIFYMTGAEHQYTFEFIEEYIINPDKLLDEAIKWCEKER